MRTAVRRVANPRRPYSAKTVNTARCRRRRWAVGTRFHQPHAPHDDRQHGAGGEPGAVAAIRGRAAESPAAVGAGRARAGRPGWPSASLPLCWHPLSIHIETPGKGRGGCSRMTVSAAVARRGRPRPPAVRTGPDVRHPRAGEPVRRHLRPVHAQRAAFGTGQSTGVVFGEFPGSGFVTAAAAAASGAAAAAGSGTSTGTSTSIS